MSRPRSRSRNTHENGPMWGHPEPDRPHDHDRTLTWNYTPALRRIRRVLILVDITQVRHLMEEQFSDAMTVTSCLTLPDLRDPEEMAMFTYSRLLNPSQLQTTWVGKLLSGISQYIFSTWGVNIDADDMDLCWSDATGDIFALRNPHTISRFFPGTPPKLGPGPRHKKLGSSALQYRSIAHSSRTSCACPATRPCRPITFRDCFRSQNRPFVLLLHWDHVSPVTFFCAFWFPLFSCH